MADPRIARTRLHVRQTVVDMLSRGDEVSISSVAEQVLVSRRTIYAHWGAIEELVADSVFADSEGEERDTFLRTYRNALTLLPAMVRELLARRRQPIHPDGVHEARP